MLKGKDKTALVSTRYLPTNFYLLKDHNSVKTCTSVQLFMSLKLSIGFALINKVTKIMLTCTSFNPDYEYRGYIILLINVKYIIPAETVKIFLIRVSIPLFS